MIYQPEIETMGRAEMEALQLKRLQETVAYVYERVPMYKERLDALRVKPEDIQSLDDIRRLPFTVKDDLRDHYPYDLFAVPMKEIVRIHASSGTTGRPTVVGYTRDDIEMWSADFFRLRSVHRRAGAASGSEQDRRGGYSDFVWQYRAPDQSDGRLWHDAVGGYALLRALHGGSR